MYAAINNRLIIKMPGDGAMESGIIVSQTQENSPINRMEVVECGENERFKGKIWLQLRL